MGPSDHARDWLKKLGTLISPAMTQQEFAGRINVLAPELVQEFPPDAFTPETARLVARQCKFFPNFAEICTALEPWAKEQRTAREYAALPPPRGKSPEPYNPSPAPAWCFDRKPRLLGRHSRDEIADLVQPPRRSPAQQYAELTGCSLAEAEAKFGNVLAHA
jgi:hypothetical protein